MGETANLQKKMLDSFELFYFTSVKEEFQLGLSAKNNATISSHILLVGAGVILHLRMS